VKIKTYVAENIQEAFYKVKSEMGKDAVILKTKYIKKGGFMGLFAKRMVEVVAANDIKTNSELPLKQELPTFQPINAKSAESVEDAEIDDLKTDIKEVKKLLSELYLDTKVRQSKKNEIDASMPLPLKKYYDRLYEMEIDPDIIDMLINNVKNSISDADLNDSAILYETLKKEIVSFVNDTEPILLPNKNNIVAFVGPTGVGKTTTIAKLATHFSLYKNKKVALLTADTFRVGAIEQLQHYGDLLEIPVHVIHRQEDVKEILAELKDYDLLLVDTMGFNPNDRMKIKRLKGLLDALNPDDVYVVISAATKNRDLIDILNNYRELSYNKIIITKFDETKSYGVILNALKVGNCKLSYFTMGQNVPDDIELPSAGKIASMILGEE